MNGSAVEGCIFRLTGEIAVIDLPPGLGIDQRQIGGGAFFQPPGGQAQQIGRRASDLGQHIRQGHLPIVIKIERDRQEGFQPDTTKSRLHER